MGDAIICIFFIAIVVICILAATSKSRPAQIKALKDGIDKVSRKVHANESTSPGLANITDEQYRELLQRLYAVEQKCANPDDLTVACRSLSQDLSVVRESVQRLSDEINEIGNRMTAMEGKLQSGGAGDGESEPTKPVHYPVWKYASQIDSYNPDGFSRESLCDESSNMVYEITINDPSNATFCFVANEKIQGELLGIINSGILSATCEFCNFPSGYVTGMENVSEGKLTFRDGVWIITKKITLKYV